MEAKLKELKAKRAAVEQAIAALETLRAEYRKFKKSRRSSNGARVESVEKNRNRQIA